MTMTPSSIGLIRPPAILWIQLKMMLWSLFRPKYWMRQMVTGTHTVCVKGAPWIILAHYYVYIAWDDGEVMYEDTASPYYTEQMKEVVKIIGEGKKHVRQ